MLKLGLALTASVLCLALPAAYAVAAKPGPRTVEQQLLDRMNSGPAGNITRRVECVPDPKGRRTLACKLVGTASTTLDVDVDVVAGGLRTIWHPVEG